jgi:TonB family protein
VATPAAKASLTQQAKATPVAYPFSAPKAAAPAPAPKVSIAPRAAFRDVITAHLNSDIEDFADQHSGTIAYHLGENPDAQTPRLVRVVGRALPIGFTPDDHTTVSVRMVVDPHGVPSDVTITHSAGHVLDERTLEAVNQYRFRPATLNNIPVDSDITLDILLVKK